MSKRHEVAQQHRRHEAQPLQSVYRMQLPTVVVVIPITFARIVSENTCRFVRTPVLTRGSRRLL